MRKLLLTLFVFTLFGAAQAQVYLYNGFEDAFVGTPAAPGGGGATIPSGSAGNWTQTRLNISGASVVNPTHGVDGQQDWIKETYSTSWSPTPGSGTTPTGGAFAGTGALFIQDYFLEVYSMVQEG